MAATVSDDMIVQILSQLPVKSLLRFNCVCRTWYDIISDPQFSNDLHRTRPSVLICEDLREFSAVPIESLLTKDRAPAPISIPWEETEQPVGGRSENTCIGSCNGLICVDHKNGGSSSGLIIGNPSTRKFKRLARPGCYSDRFSKQEGLVRIPPDMWTYAWFGYHESIHDYKLVWSNFSHFGNPGPASAKLDVFTLKSNTWRSREVDHIPVHGLNYLGRSDSTRGVLCNNAIHWITNYTPVRYGLEEVRILVLDLATENFRLLKFPHGELFMTTRLGSLEGGGGGGGGLWLFNHVFPYTANFWMMKEYGVEPTWTKLLSIPNCGYDGFISYPILFWKENEGKETVVICIVNPSKSIGGIAKLRVEEGGGKVKNEEMLLCLPPFAKRSNVILHMEESLVSISPFPSQGAGGALRS